MEYDNIVCAKCGKKIPLNRSYPGFLCYECFNNIKEPESKNQDSEMNNGTKEPPTSIAAIILKAIMIIIYIGFILLLVIGCLGNFFNVDESPFPVLHWKAD